MADPIPPIPDVRIPNQYTSLDAFKQAYPTLSQNQQLQIKIFESSKNLFNDLLGILFSSEVQKRTIISDDDDDGSTQEVISHVPNNIMRCPVMLNQAKIDEDPETEPEECDQQVDMLPYKVNLSKPPKPYCDIHKKWMKWTSWNPPLREAGFKEVMHLVTSTMSDSVSNSTFPTEFDVVTYSIGFSEGVEGTIYENADEWINNEKIFLGEEFWYTFENTIITNVQSAVYKSKTHLVKDLIKSWNVNEEVSQNKQGGTLQPAISKFKSILGV